MTTRQIPHPTLDFAGRQFAGPVHLPTEVPPRPGILLILDEKDETYHVVGVRPEEMLMLAMQEQKANPLWNHQIRGQQAFAYMIVEDDDEAIRVAADAAHLIVHQRRPRAATGLTNVPASAISTGRT